jgi:hypothetical protein
MIAMSPTAATVRMILNGQMGKAGAPMHGKDLHIGDFDAGVFLGRAADDLDDDRCGMAMAFRSRRGPRRRLLRRRRRDVARRVARGDQHLRRAQASRDLLRARTTRPRSRLRSRSIRGARVRRKGAGYGIPGITIDGTDPDAIAAAFAWAAERARRARARL